MAPKRPRRTRILASLTANGIGTVRELDLPPTPPTRAQQLQDSPVVRFLRLSWQNWRLLAPALIAAVVASCCSVLQPLLFGRIIGVLSRAEMLPYDVARTRLFRRVGRLGAVYCLEIMATVIFVALVSRTVDKSTRQLRELVFQKTLQNDIGFFDDAGRVDIERTLAKEITVVRDNIWKNLSRDRGIRAILEVILGMVVCLCVTGAIGAPVYGCLVPIVSTLVAQMGLRNGRMETRMSLKDSGIQAFLNEKFRGVRTLKAFGAEQREGRELDKLLDSAEHSAKQLGLSKALTEAANRISIYVTIVVFFLLGGLMICAGSLTYELFSCLTGFIWILNFAMQGISFTITDATTIAASLKNIYSLLDRANAYSEARKRVFTSSLARPLTFRGEVQFNHVSFHYPSRPDVLVLKGINFAIQPGQTFALVGDSGGGKSTIAAMLTRFYAPTSGSVTLDNIDIQSLPSEVYAKECSLVDQEPILFRGSIKENVAYGLPDEDVDDEDIVRAAKEANAHEFIVQLSNGYDTIWSPESNFSGGQRQRIAIARSLVKSPRILVLDEATSALDQESERMVQSALERVMKNRTVLIIAHRLSTVRSADRILFVKAGRIVEEGTYDELFAKPDGHFRALINSANQVVAKTSPKI